MNTTSETRLVPLRTAGGAGRRMLRIDQVTDRVGVGRTTVYALIRTHGFPQGVRISKARVVWPEDEVDAWLAARIAAARASA